MKSFLCMFAAAVVLGQLHPVAEFDPADTRSGGAVLRFPGDAAAEGAIDVDAHFSPERIAASLARVRALWSAHSRLQNTFFHASNLGDFDPGTNENPYVFDVPERLPDDAVIRWELDKEAFTELGLPAWDTLELGGANALANLEAAFAYLRYKDVAHRLAGLEEGAPEGEREALEAERVRLRNAVTAYFETPPAD